jgi:hypothetical protein
VLIQWLWMVIDKLVSALENSRNVRFSSSGDVDYLSHVNYRGLNRVVWFNAGLTGLTHLDLFGARITDAGTTYLRCKCACSKDYPSGPIW